VTEIIVPLPVSEF